MKSNRASKRREAEAEVERRAKVMLLAALVRKLGEFVDAGGRRIVLSEQDLVECPPGEELSISRLPGSHGVVLALSYPEVPVARERPE